MRVCNGIVENNKSIKKQWKWNHFINCDKQKLKW